MTDPLADAVALVTGATSGIGRSVALALACRGAAVCAVGRRDDVLKEVARQAAGRGGRASTYATDLTCDEQVDELVEGVRREHGRVDVLVHSAAVFARGMIGTARVEELDQQYRTNLRAPYVLTARLLPLIPANAGQIVFVNSTAGLTAAGGVAAYASVKHALRGLADALRAEVNPRGIRVLSVFLGRSATPMQMEVHRLEGKAYRPDRLVQPEDVASMILHALSMPRTAEVTDMTIRPLANANGPR